MHAIVRERYGGPEVLELRDIPAPEVADDAVLVRVRAASVNALDWHVMRGKPYAARLSEGLRRPRQGAMGVDVAGVVEGTGPAVSDLRVGDAVFGSRTGAFGELVSGRNFVPLPEGLTFEQAAAIPTAGMTALQALRDHGRVRAGHRVLVIGAGGGVGTFAVQISTALGATVTATTRPESKALVREIGAAEVLDHSQALVGAEARYDAIIDIAGTHALSALDRALAPEGRLVLVAPGAGQWVGFLLRIASAAIRSRFGRHRMIVFIAAVDRDDLLTLKGLVEGGSVRPVIDRVYPLAETAAAIGHVESGQVRGKVVVRI